MAAAGPTCRSCGRAFQTEALLEKHRTRSHAGGSAKTWLAIGAIVVLGAMAVYWLTGGAPGPATTRAANFASFGLADDPYHGNPDAPVVVVAFEAPRCTSCRQFHLNVMPGLQERYFDTGKAVLYYVQFTAGYDLDRPAGIVQECLLAVGGREAFWGFTDALYEEQPAITVANLDARVAAYVQEKGLDSEAVQDCRDGADGETPLELDWGNAYSHGASGTPTFFVFGPEGEAVRPTMSQLEATMQDAGAL